MHPFKYKKHDVVTIIATNEDALVVADQRFGVVAVKTRTVDVLLVMHEDLKPARKVYTAESYDRTTVT